MCIFCHPRESLYEDEEFDQRQLAALLVSKVMICFFCVLTLFTIRARISMGAIIISLLNPLNYDNFLLFVGVTSKMVVRSNNLESQTILSQIIMSSMSVSFSPWPSSSLHSTWTFVVAVFRNVLEKNGLDCLL